MAVRCFSPGALGIIILYFLLQQNDSTNSTTLNIIPQEQQIEQLSIDESENSENKSDIQTTFSVVVDVKGAVKFPGVYELTAEDRIIDAIHIAGGYTDEAETRFINHAQKLQDEMVIYIPEKGEDIEQISVLGQVSGSALPQKNGENKVNINTADETQLAALPGIGPSKAQAIISYRDEMGLFQTVDDLKNISGIGDKTFEKLKDLIIVK